MRAGAVVARAAVGVCIAIAMGCCGRLEYLRDNVVDVAHLREQAEQEKR
jgi:hypothetical protein